LAGQTSEIAGGLLTVKEAVQVVFVGAQLLVQVNVTVVVPPQLDGAAPALLITAPLHPPLPLAVPSHAVNSAFTCACV
jgi:hypothetical protein